MSDVLKNYNKALQEIYDHVGFKEDWVVCPIDDASEYFWSIIGVNRAVRYIEIDKPYIQKEIEDGNYYEDEIYQQRFYSKWIYRGKDFTMIFCNPGVDGMKWFRVFDNKLQIKNWDNAIKEIRKKKLSNIQL